jgi:hypothetical protein
MGLCQKKDILNGIVAFRIRISRNGNIIHHYRKEKIKPPTALIGFYFGKKSIPSKLVVSNIKKKQSNTFDPFKQNRIGITHYLKHEFCIHCNIGYLK